MSYGPLIGGIARGGKDARGTDTPSPRHKSLCRGFRHCLGSVAQNLGQQAEFLFARAVLAPHQRHASIGMLRFQRAGDDVGIVQYSVPDRSEEHTSELQSLMRISYAVFCWKKKTQTCYKHTQRSI